MIREGRISRQPSPYGSSLLFHGLRVVQVISSIIVTSFLAFFIRHLEIAMFYVPWTFILLLSVSVFTLASFITTSILHHNRTLKPKFNAMINGFLSILWMLGFALLMWNLSVTLTHQCSIANWSTDAGVMVCMIYKTIAAFATTGMVSTLLATLYDIRTHRLAFGRGTYNPMAEPKILSASPYESTRSVSYHDGPAATTTSYSDMDIDTREQPLQSPEWAHEAKGTYKTQRPIEVNQFGYSAPSEQTAYDGARVSADLGMQWGRNGDGA